MRLLLALLIALTTAAGTTKVRGQVEVRLGKRRLAVASVAASYPSPLMPCPLTLRITTRDKRVPSVVIRIADILTGRRPIPVGRGAALELTVAGATEALAATSGGIELSYDQQVAKGQFTGDFGALGQLRGSFRVPDLGCLWDLE